MNKIKELIQRLKSIKHIEIIVCVIIIAVLLIIYFNVNEDAVAKSSKTSETSDSEQTGLTDGLEERLSSILSEIDGAGEVKVMITYVSTSEQVTASTNNSHTTTTNGTNGQTTTTTTTTSSPIISNSQVIVLQEKMPEVKGVIIVADGASNVKVRLSLLQATSTVLGVNANSIQIFTRRDV